MINRELLERAAKAGGYDVAWNEHWQCFQHRNPSPDKFGNVRHPWVPLDDDGDAFRLGVDLSLLHNLDERAAAVAAEVDFEICPREATRLVIVRAAAEIGMRIGRDVELQSEVKPEEVKRIIDPALRQCHAKDCWECGGTGYSASSGMICRTNDEPPF